MNAVSFEHANALFAYDVDSGEVTRKVTVNSRGRAGQKVGSVNCDGYLVVQVEGRKFMLHRIVWLLARGAWPLLQIDHINGLRSDNRIANLREATNSQNQRNTTPRASVSGLKGVYWHKRASKWCAQIVADGQHEHLGLFQSAGQAHAAYCAAADRLHGEFARTK